MFGIFFGIGKQFGRFYDVERIIARSLIGAGNRVYFGNSFCDFQLRFG